MSHSGAIVLLVGSGGREHALAWKLLQSKKVARLIAVPGNDGFPREVERWALPVTRESLPQIAAKAKQLGVELAVIGPDNALADGAVDAFEAVGIAAFGPSAAAARLESSKAFAKEVMQAAGVPTARYVEARSREDAKKYLRSVPWAKDGGWVLKADGLALGKGVRVCETLEGPDGALAAADALFGLSGSLVIEEKVCGDEISWLAFCDGERAALLEPARDHKRLCDHDEGPNTGGMGAFSPVPGIPEAFGERLRREVFEPVLAEMRKRGTPFRGVLYAGLMVDFKRDRYWVLEFNARFGDPETQVLLPRMEGDLFDWCMSASAPGGLARLPASVPFKRDAAVVVVLASSGYPEAPIKGDAIAFEKPYDTQGAVPSFFVAGASSDGKGGLKTSGGRVLGALGTGPTLQAARDQAYANAAAVRFEGMQYRRDIAGPVLRLQPEARQ